MDNVTYARIKFLYKAVGPTLMAVAAGAGGPETIRSWIRHDSVTTNTQLLKLEVLEEVFNQVAEVDGPGSARKWLIGPNCLDGLTSPAQALGRGNFEEVRASAARFINPEQG